MSAHDRDSARATDRFSDVVGQTRGTSEDARARRLRTERETVDRIGRWGELARRFNTSEYGRTVSRDDERDGLEVFTAPAFQHGPELTALKLAYCAYQIRDTAHADRDYRQRLCCTFGVDPQDIEQSTSEAFGADSSALCQAAERLREDLVAAATSGRLTGSVMREFALTHYRDIIAGVITHQVLVDADRHLRAALGPEDAASQRALGRRWCRPRRRSYKHLAADHADSLRELVSDQHRHAYEPQPFRELLRRALGQ